MVRAEIRCIAAARKAGAHAAHGDVLCFVDADSQIHPDTFNVTIAYMDRPDVIGGATGVKLERWYWYQPGR